MDKPVLVIMAAGIGSRYGGLKQIDPIDDQNHLIIDFSIYDAIKAGFEKVIFIIKREIEADFKERIGDRIEKYIQVEYVYQDPDDLPAGFKRPKGRVKPWGTGHAVLSCLGKINGPFAVINADDYYGRSAFEKIYKFLNENKDDEKYHYAMVGYELQNTLTENGHVARGVCVVDDSGELVTINERTHIEKHGDKVEYTEDDGKTWVSLPKDSLVSMNMWGFSNSFMDELEKRFISFLDNELAKNPEKAEYFLPFVVDELLKENKATAAVLPTPDVWHGVTYKEDKPGVMAAIKALKDAGMYPDVLWA